MTSQASSRTPDSEKPAEAPCSECRGTGYFVTEQGTIAPCSCGALDEIQAAERLRQARIPDRYANKSLDTFKTDRPERKKLRDDAKRYAHSFSREEDRGLLFEGGTGVGKTHIAIGILRDVIKRGFTGVYCNVTELLARLRSTYEEDAEEAESEVLDEYIGCDLLVLDDLGNESTSAWVLDRLYLLINRRYESNRPVIVTTNCHEKDLEEKVGPRIASRLCEMCSRSFKFPKHDYRKAQLSEQMTH